MPRDESDERRPREQSPQPREDEALRQRINSAWSRLIRRHQPIGEANLPPTDATPTPERDKERPTSASLAPLFP